MFPRRYTVFLSALLSVSAAYADFLPPAGIDASQNEKHVKWELGAMMQVSSPIYKGTSPDTVGLPVVTCESEYVYIRGQRIGFKVLNTKHLECSLLAEYNSHSFDNKDSCDARMKTLDDRHDGLLGGAEVRFITPVGLFFASAAFDLTNKGSGFTGRCGYGLTMEFGPFEISPLIGMEWNDARFNNYYYGISGDESAASGLAAYRPQRGFSPYAELHLCFELNRNWFLFATGEVMRLSSAVRNSPMVDRTAAYSWGFGIGYEF